MKKRLLIASLIFAISLTGCKDEPEEEIIYGEIVEDTIQITQEIIQEPEETSELEIVPEIPEETTEELKFVNTLDNNISNDFMINKITINDNTYSLPIATSELQELKQCPFATASHDTSDYIFEGKGYGIQSDPSDIMSFNGTTIFFSTDNGNITGCTFNTFWEKGDLVITFADFIQLGTPKSEVEEKLGSGAQNGNKFLYKNDFAVLAIEYEDDLVEDITILTRY